MRMLRKMTFANLTVIGLLPILTLALLEPASASAAPPTQNTGLYCLGEAATIVYIGYDAAIYGTSGDDVIVVHGGWNRVHADSGDDKICVTGHFNVLRGEDGHDQFLVSGLHNTLRGDDGDDVLNADDVSNLLQGDDGANRCNQVAC